MGGDPGILQLRSVIVLANDTIHCDSVTGNRLHIQLIISGAAICGVGAVDSQNITCAVGDLHVAISGVVHFSDNTGNIIHTGSIDIMILGCTQCNSLSNGQSAAISGISGLFGLNRLLTLHNLQQFGSSKLYLVRGRTLVVGNHTINGNHIADTKIFNSLTTQAEAFDRLIFATFNNNRDGDIIILFTISSIDFGNFTSQSGIVRQEITGLQLVGIVNNLRGIGGSLGCLTLLNMIQRTAGSKLNDTFIVHQCTCDGNHIVDV